MIKTTSPHKYFTQWFSNDSIIIKKLYAKPIKKLRNQDQKEEEKKTKFQPAIILYFRIDDGDEVTPNFFGKSQWMCVYFFLCVSANDIKLERRISSFFALAIFCHTDFIWFCSIGACKPKIKKVFNQCWLPDMAIEQRCVAQPCNIYKSLIKKQTKEKIDKNT